MKKITLAPYYIKQLLICKLINFLMVFQQQKIKTETTKKEILHQCVSALYLFRM